MKRFLTIDIVVQGEFAKPFWYTSKWMENLLYNFWELKIGSNIILKMMQILYNMLIHWMTRSFWSKWKSDQRRTAKGCNGDTFHPSQTHIIGHNAKTLQEWSEINLKIILSPRVLWYGNGNTVDCICFNWRLYASCTIISYIKNILCHTIRVYYITSLWAIKKMHVRLSTFSCWHVFHCIDWAWGTTSGTVRCICHRVRILIDWRILKIAVLNPERLNILINRYTLSSNRTLILFLAIVLWCLLRPESFSST